MLQDLHNELNWKIQDVQGDVQLVIPAVNVCSHSLKLQIRNIRQRWHEVTEQTKNIHKELGLMIQGEAQMIMTLA
jgi:hypothetical protein